VETTAAPCFIEECECTLAAAGFSAPELLLALLPVFGLATVCFWRPGRGKRPWSRGGRYPREDKVVEFKKDKDEKDENVVLNTNAWNVGNTNRPPSARSFRITVPYQGPLSSARWLFSRSTTPLSTPRTGRPLSSRLSSIAEDERKWCDSDDELSFPQTIDCLCDPVPERGEPDWQGADPVGYVTTTAPAGLVNDHGATFHDMLKAELPFLQCTPGDKPYKQVRIFFNDQKLVLQAVRTMCTKRGVRLRTVKMEYNPYVFDSPRGEFD
jgi:hypothetical protein